MKLTTKMQTSKWTQTYQQSLATINTKVDVRGLLGIYQRG